jgi:hypothetical protein
METRNSSLPKQKESHMRSTDCNASLTVDEDNSVNYVDLLDYRIPCMFFQVTADKVMARNEGQHG